ncbi:MAG: M1 family metallopeptidase [Lunatimonas sp.]|uniref:M1 family metallopeptidase n=1 Tax=Lunatimonas sp. TaxID=2060141 RepID=UPI00263AE423|nr:M1 family metallopeptidase [Lunatimonas sp.]MCC5938617.1 M1 family metallopeptidase [Lunatimonas sp.]
MTRAIYRVLRGLTALWLCSLVTLGGAFGQQPSWNWGGPLDPVQATFDITMVYLELEILPEEKAITGSATLSLEYVSDTDQLRFQLIDAYTVDRVEAEGVLLPFSHQSDLIDVRLGELRPGSVTIFYGGKTPIAVRPPWLGGFTWEKDDLGYHWMGLSSQNEGGKLFMPCLDHPKSKPKNGVQMRITVPEVYTVAANGLLKDSFVEHGKATFLWESSYPIMNYNINFTMGKFHREAKTFRSLSGYDIPMVVYVLEENKERAPLLLEVLDQSTRTHERFFGPFPFPKEKIAVVETPYLGMEHQTINAYGNNFQFVRMGEVWYDHLLHHELGHEWFGNKVSIADWSDYWIHEGITSYGDWLFYLQHEGEEAYHAKVADARKRIQNKKPVVSPPNSFSDEAYHSDVYAKGAYIIHSLRFLLGDERFFPLLKRIADQEAFTYENQVGTEELINFLERESGVELGPFLRRYLYEASLPTVKVSRKRKTHYQVSISGIDFSLPVEVKTHRGIERIELNKVPTNILSEVPIEVDPRNWYLLRK